AAEVRGVTIHCHAVATLPMIEIDAALIERALANLVENALRYTPAGGSIALSAAAADAGISINVNDTGCGIANADMERVFERFFQSTHSREGNGHAGLGLAIVKRVAALHNGHVAVRNRSGNGACFTLWLPLTPSDSL
ncbi:MAG TPA: two-component sensor histidine kinase, partial [Betaproteobacteria bacterium]|nr:two-component sensor histidine kinase [Betaproteobacteria bacterium]